MRLLRFLSLFACVGMVPAFTLIVMAASGQRPMYRGVSLSSAEFGYDKPGVFGKDYVYPTRSEVDYYAGALHMTVFRLPFLWERLQHKIPSNLDSAELSRLDEFVTYATGKGILVILDPHNYARYYGRVVGEGGPSKYDFAEFWRQLAEHYRGNARVAYGLMNEPYGMATETWADAAQEAIYAIRGAGSGQLILVPGNAWSGAWSWSDRYYGTPNSEVMLRIKDPGGNYAFEVHQYLDSDNSGTHDGCVSRTIGREKLAGFTRWLRDHGLRGFLGEVAGGNNAVCRAAVDDALGFVEENSDVWLGWAWWGGGPWWGNYMFSIEPGHSPEMVDILRRHL